VLLRRDGVAGVAGAAVAGVAGAAVSWLHRIAMLALLLPRYMPAVCQPMSQTLREV